MTNLSERTALTFNELGPAWPLRFANAWIERTRYVIDGVAWRVRAATMERLLPLDIIWHETWKGDE